MKTSLDLKIFVLGTALLILIVIVLHGHRGSPPIWDLDNSVTETNTSPQ